LCEDFEVSGLANHHHGYGLGVPLIATSPAAPIQEGPAEYPHGISLPVTAFFRFEGSLADLGAGRSGRLELYNPLAVEAVEVRGRTVPLETDLTTPLAYYLANSRMATDSILGFVRADKLRKQSGIHMLAPYQPGKIPVVLVHGLLSSPLTWAPVFNDLQADPMLRERFQFWYYFYPTGNPYLVTAANLRQDLAGLREDIDPGHRDPALDQMVFVGHSMGGLVSRLLTVDSGEDFWHLVSNRPLDELRLQPASRADLREMFFFKPVPNVRRVVFIGTPHHGSRLSPSPLGRLADKVVRLPGTLMSAAHDLSTENPDLTSAIHLRQIPTSVDLLAPGSRALEELASRPRPPGVHYHTIAGVVHTTAVKLENLLAGDHEPGDGVVPYRSAHLETAESELVVPADHFDVHHHPLSIMEIRRILLEHYREMAGELGHPSSAGPTTGPLTPARSCATLAPARTGEPSP
jgi:pimeloyl-ACP methyl ester carboxylesterase